MPIPSTHTRASAGSDRRRWNLAIEALAPARCREGYRNSGPKATIAARTWSSPMIW